MTDSRTGLVWQRCSAGLAWSGETCTGSVFSSPHEDALVFARLQSGWRLPNVKELASLIDLGFENPAIDTIAFPGTPAGCHWTSTPVVGVSGAWQVSFFDGLVQGLYRSGYCFARLVR